MSTQYQGQLHKMHVQHTDPIQYQLQLGEQRVDVNALLGKSIELHFLGEINCIQCGRKTKKSFQSGFCFPCMQRINECNNCMIHPERCKVEEGGCPTDDWAHAQCHAKHVVYLANSSGLKVGITRVVNQPMRWIDQGALQALPIFETQNRYQCGLVEVALRQYVADKTNWRKMLKNDVTLMDLVDAKNMLLSQAKNKLAPILSQYKEAIIPIENADAFSFHYPVITYPEKVKSLSFDKTPDISGVLQGIKGQYLLLDTGVLNIRKFGGYQIALNAEPH